MRVEKQTHWMTKFSAFVMSFVVIGAPDALAETAAYQYGVNNNYQVSMIDYSVDSERLMRGVEFKMPSKDARDWRLGIGVSDDRIQAAEPNSNLNVVLYFTSAL